MEVNKSFKEYRYNTTLLVFVNIFSYVWVVMLIMSIQD